MFLSVASCPASDGPDAVGRGTRLRKPGAPCWGLEGFFLFEPQALHLIEGPGAWRGPAGGVGTGIGASRPEARALGGTALREPTKAPSHARRAV